MMSSHLDIAMLSIHSSPLGKLGTRDTGGMSVYLLETAVWLGKMGHSIDLFTLGQPAMPTSITPVGKNVRLIRLSINSCEKPIKENLLSKMPLIFEAFELFFAEQKKKYSLIHSHYWLSGVLGQMLHEKHKLLHCISFHTLGAVKKNACLGENEPDNRISNEEKLVTYCDELIVFTQEEKNKLISIYGGKQDKITIIPCGVNHDIFVPCNVDDAKARIGLHGNTKVLLFVGRYVPVKGLDQLLEAISFLDTRMLVKLIIVGGDDMQSDTCRDLIQKIKNLSIENQVLLAGRVEQAELPMYYSAADALVVPSYHESFSLVTLEALSCGTPVIGTSVGVIPEVIKDGNGLVIKNNKARLLADAIKELVVHNSVPLQNKSQIRMSVLKYSWQKTAVELLGAYRNMMNTSKGKIN